MATTVSALTDVLGLAEEALDLGLEKRLSLELGGQFLRSLEQVAVGPQAGEAKVRDAGLPRTDELPLTADLEVPLGELETVGRLDHRLEALGGDLGELVAVTRDEQAVRLLRSPADAAA